MMLYKQEKYPLSNNPETFYKEEASNLRQEIRKFESEVPQQSDINILVMGPSVQAKTALIQTLSAAFHNKKQCLSETATIQGGWVSKTQLTHNKKYRIEGSKKELQRKNINFLQYCQTVNSKTISQFSKLFYQFIPSILVPECGSAIQNSLPMAAKVTVFCFESGMPLSEDEYCYTNLLISNLQEQGFSPIIVLVNIFQPVKWINQKSVIDRKELEIRNFSNGFSIPRDQIFFMQCYNESSELNDEINFYALQILLIMIRQTEKVSQTHKQVRPKIPFCF